MGSTSSQSASTNSTVSKDQRVVADGSGIGLSGSSRNNINITDAGIVEKSLAFLAGAESANTDRLELMLGASGETLAQGARLLAGNEAANTDRLDMLLDAGGGLLDVGVKMLAGNEAANTERLELLLNAGGALLDSNLSVGKVLTAQVLEAKKAADTPASVDQSKIALYGALALAGVILLKGLK